MKLNLSDFFLHQIFPNRSNRPWGFVSDRYKFIYIPIFKNANTSLRHWFQQVEGLGLSRQQLHEDDLYPRLHDLHQRDYRDYFKFCFVRNPWDRIVSCYINQIRKEKPTNKWFREGIPHGFVHYKLFYAEMSFEEFVKTICRIPDYDADQHFLSQVRSVLNRRGKSIVDEYYRFEDFERNLQKISKKLNVCPVTIEHYNKSIRTKYQDYYTPKTRQMIAKRYREDIRFFGYEF